MVRCGGADELGAHISQHIEKLAATIHGVTPWHRKMPMRPAAIRDTPPSAS
jgi:hypothetical protein